MRLILFGAPGSGKGTQANSLSKYYKIKKISLGDILREEVKKKSLLGKNVKSYMDNGVLVPDKIVFQVIEEKLSKIEGFVLDGYPRNTKQAVHLESVLAKDGGSVDKVVYLDVDVKTVLNRLQKRRLCNSCGALYHLVNMPPAKEGICDACGGELIQRADDAPGVISERWRIFIQESKPILDYYEQAGKLVKVDASSDKDKVLNAVKALIGHG